MNNGSTLLPIGISRGSQTVCGLVGLVFYKKCGKVKTARFLVYLRKDTQMNPPLLSATRYYGMPEHVVWEMNHLELANNAEDTSNTFLDMNLNRVRMPKHEGEDKPRLTKNHYIALWNLRCGNIRTDGTQLYARNACYDGTTSNGWHPVNSIEEEYQLAVSGRNHIGNLSPLFANESRKLQPMRHGIRFATHAYYVENRRIHLVEASQSDPYLLSFDGEWLEDTKQTMQAIREAEHWCEWLTADTDSKNNLLRLFATPFLEPYKHLTYVLWGNGGDGKSFLFNQLQKAFPTMANGVSISTLTHGNTFDRGNEALKIDGRYWVYDEEGDISDEDMGTIKRISTGDTLQARGIGRNSVNVRSQATLCIATNHRLQLSDSEANRRRMVTIRMGGRKTIQQMEPLERFINRYGMVPFLLASARLWQAQPDDSCIVSAEIDEAIDVSDKLAWMICEIIDHGYVRPTDYRGPAERLRNGALASVGLKRSCIRVDGRNVAVYNVGDERRFAPYRRMFQPEMPPRVEDMTRVEHEGLVRIPGTIMVPAGQHDDRPKVAVDWKKNMESGEYSDSWNPDGTPYAVIPDTGMMVIDCDSAKDDGEHGWMQLQESNSVEPTFTVRTPHDGLHLYYQLPKEWYGRLRNGVHRNGLNIDLRLERKGYVIGPETVTGDGSYDIVDARPVAMAPTALLNWLAGNGYADTPAKTVYQAAGGPNDGKPDMSPISEGSRNTTLFTWALGRAKNHMDNLPAIEHDLYERGHASNLSDGELATIWKSVKTYL